MNDAAAQAYLTGLPGVGPKKAACVLLFSLSRPLMPVDTHVHRVARRLGIIDDRVTAAQAHPLTGLAGPHEVHVHGRRGRPAAGLTAPSARLCPRRGRRRLHRACK